MNRLWPRWYNPVPCHIPVSLLIDRIAASQGMTRDQIVGESRDQEIVPVRWAVAMVLRERGLSYPVIGRMMRRDHSSIRHACMRFGDKARRDNRWMVALFDARKVAAGETA